jgi:hypothetical protein
MTVAIGGQESCRAIAKKRESNRTKKRKAVYRLKIDIVNDTLEKGNAK